MEEEERVLVAASGGRPMAARLPAARAGRQKIPKSCLAPALVLCGNDGRSRGRICGPRPATRGEAGTCFSTGLWMPMLSPRLVLPAGPREVGCLRTHSFGLLLPSVPGSLGVRGREKRQGRAPGEEEEELKRGSACAGPCGLVLRVRSAGPCFSLLKRTSSLPPALQRNCDVSLHYPFSCW